MHAVARRERPINAASLDPRLPRKRMPVRRRRADRSGSSGRATRMRRPCPIQQPEPEDEPDDRPAVARLPASLAAAAEAGRAARSDQPRVRREPGGRVGKYELRAKLGRGTFGVVYTARDPEPRPRRRDQGPQPDAPRRTRRSSQRFLQEARATARDRAPGHRHDPRLRPGRDRSRPDRVHRDGAAVRREPDQPADAIGGRLAPATAVRDRAPGRVGARGRASRRRRCTAISSPTTSTWCPTRRCRAASASRSSTSGSRSSAPDGHTQLADRVRDAALHVARAVPLGGAGRSPQRHLLARLHPVRARHRPPAVRWRRPPADRAPPARRSPPRASVARARAAVRARRSDRRDARQGPDGPAADDGGGPARAAARHLRRGSGDRGRAAEAG